MLNFSLFKNRTVFNETCAKERKSFMYSERQYQIVSLVIRKQNMILLIADLKLFVVDSPGDVFIHVKR